MPAGPLREPAKRLQKADLVLLNGPPTADLEVGFHEFGLSPVGAVSLDGLQSAALEEFAGQRVWMVAGIGNPDRFRQVLVAAGIDAVPVPVGDHACVSLEELRRQESWPVFMTEKDAVKYSSSPIDDVWYVPVKITMPESTKVAVIDRLEPFCPPAKDA